jgi:hypothetical protein
VAARRATASLSAPGATTATAAWGPASAPGTDNYAVAVTDDGRTLGRVTVEIPRGRRLRPSDERLLRGLADQAAVAFRNVALELRLADHVADLDRATHALAESRARLVEADDEARRGLERAISEKVLPHLVRVSDRLTSTDPAPAEEAGELEGLVAEVNTALESLRELTRGVFPTQLARAGIEPALRSFLSRHHLTTTLHVDPTLAGRRFPDRVEAAVWFCATRSALSEPPPSRILLEPAADGLVLTVREVGGGAVDRQGIVDRVEAAGGTLSADGRQLELRIPADVEGAGAALVAAPRL